MAIIAIGGCGKMDIINEPAPAILQADEVCIIDHVDTRETYRTALKKWFRKQGIKTSVFPEKAADDTCEWTIRYYGRWSWDIVVFLADTQITAYHDGVEAGRVGLVAGQLDTYKWEDGEERIFKLMDMLSGKTDHYVLPESKKKNKQTR